MKNFLKNRILDSNKKNTFTCENGECNVVSALVDLQCIFATAQHIVWIMSRGRSNFTSETPLRVDDFMDSIPDRLACKITITKPEPVAI
jgi:hypothetical protein